MSPHPLPAIVLTLTGLAFAAKGPAPVPPTPRVEAPHPAPPAQFPLVAPDDYRINLDGVTVNAYALPPPAEGPAHARSMANGIVGKAVTP